MTRLRHDKSGGTRAATSSRATPAGSAGDKGSGSKSGPVTSNQPPKAAEPMCCNMVLPKSGVCPVCSD